MKFPLNYGLNGLDSPSMVEKTLNSILVENLLNPQLYPFLHIVENMSGVYKTISFSNVTFRVASSSPLAT